MAKGIEFTQYVFRDDGEDMIGEDAEDLLMSFLKLMEGRGLSLGGSVRLIDECGEYAKPPVPPTPPSVYEETDIEEMSGDEAREQWRRIKEAAEAFLAIMHKEQE